MRHYYLTRSGRLSRKDNKLLFELSGEQEENTHTKHINNVFKEGELDKESNVQKMHIPKSDRPVTLYNLDVIISIGYRVKSQRVTQFRQWATQRLKHSTSGETRR